MVSRMRAAIVRERGSVRVEDVEIDEPGPREILVDTAAAAICHSDIGYLDGSFPVPPPFVLGHEAAGIVAAVGPGVTHVTPGDHVVTCLSLFCGQCEPCLTGHANLCAREGLPQRGPDERPRISQDGVPVPQMVGLGAFAERMLVHEGAVVRIREDMPLDRAALLGCGVTTGLGAVFYAAKVRPGDTVAVLGCGGVGLSAVQGARISGAARIIAIDPVAERRELARRLGATEVVDASAGDPVAAVIELTGGGVRHAFEVAGRTDTAEQAFAMLAPGGTATVVGVVFGKTLSIPTDLLRAERRIQGSLMGSAPFRVAIPRYVDLYMSGALLLDEVVTKRSVLEEIEGAIAPMLRGEGARSVIVFNQEEAGDVRP
jgi:S-(hydroxymethyl)glutathione dehydrogenase / alcohol dehydrogenase